MKSAYPMLLSPLKIRNFTLKNRMESSNSQPHFHQGPEKYPAENTFAHYIRRAKDGAAIVTVSAINDIFGMPELPASFDIAHFPHYDLYDAQCQNYIAQFFDAIHYYDSLVSVGIFSSASMYPYFHEDGTMELVDAGCKEDKSELIMEDGVVTDAITVETMEKVAASFAQQSLQLKKLGCDMVTIHMCYRGQLLGQFISPRTNLRSDEYGGDMEGRGKFPLMVFKAIRDAVGNDFLIEVEVSGEESGGNTFEEMISFLKKAEKYIDIIQVRCGEPSPSMPTNFYLEKNPTLYQAERLKKAGLNLVVCTVGGYLDPETSEQVLREGKADMIGMARAFISNPNYGELVYNGLAGDIVPCLRCNKCHGRGPADVMLSTCSVNPEFGIEQWKPMLGESVEEKKNIAVIGGGPAGMRTAMYLHDRGHTVTLYEKEATLGGLIRHADNVDFKWTLKDYKDYLIAQIAKRGITVHLNTPAAPEMLGDGYDAVIAAVGAEPVRPPVPGADGENVIFAVDALMDCSKVGQNVVVIGGGEVGVETGMYLAKQGKKVTVLEMREKIAADATFMHYLDQFQAAWEAIPTFSAVVNARATNISAEGVSYLDKDGNMHTLPADTVVLSAGMKAKRDEALSFYGCGKRFYMVGDCRKPSTIQVVNRSAYATASVI